MKRMLCASLVLFAFITPIVTHADTISLTDDFLGALVDSTKWYIPTWVSPTDGTYLGRTQMRVTQNSPLPTATSSNALITLDTYNPTGFSFYGTDLISKQTFSVGQGVSLKVRAKMNAPITPGTVGGIFLYALKPDKTLHDEIDFELLGTKPNQVQTNIYSNEPFGAGHPAFTTLASGTIGDYHTYEMKWLAGQVSWYVDDTLIRTTTSNIPAGPMEVHLNMWAPDTLWAEAYSSSIQPTASSTLNQRFSMSVDSVTVTALSAPVDNTIATITLAPTTLSLIAGKTSVLTPTARNAAGTTIATSSYAWVSSNLGVASVSANGTVTGIAPGTTTVTARKGSVTSNASIVTVSENPTITITSTPAFGVTNGSLAGKALGVSPSLYKVAVYIKVANKWWTKPYANAPLTNISTSGTWTTKVMTGGQDYLFSEARAYLVPNSFTVPVIGNADTLPSSLAPYRYATVTRTAPLESIVVTPSSIGLQVGTTSQLTATGINKVGNGMTIAPVWQSSNPLVASVNTSGLVTALTAGTTTITATNSGIVGSSAITVVAPITPSIALTFIPPFSTTTLESVLGTTGGVTAAEYDVALYIKVGQKWYTKPYLNAPLTAIKPDGSWKGNVMTGGMDWLFSEVRAYLIPKTFTVPTVFNQASLPSSLNVYPLASATRTIPPVGSIRIAPETLAVSVGGTAQITADPRDYFGNAASTTITWISADPNIASVSTSGLVTGVTVGVTTIVAMSGTATSQPVAVWVGGTPGISITSFPPNSTPLYVTTASGLASILR